jgi:hypothetical protein
MIVPSTEMGGDPLGNIPELPASETSGDPFATPPNSELSSNSSNDQSGKGGTAKTSGDVGTHVMSWSQYNSMGCWNPSSRLSQPHGAPDDSAAVWNSLSKKEVEDRNS